MAAITLGPTLPHIDNWVSNRFLLLFIFTTRTACLISLDCFRFFIFMQHRALEGQNSLTNFFKSSFVDCKEDSFFFVANLVALTCTILSFSVLKIWANYILPPFHLSSLWNITTSSSSLEWSVKVFPFTFGLCVILLKSMSFVRSIIYIHHFL